MLNPTVAKDMYNSYVYSFLEFCIPVWGGVLTFAHREHSLKSLDKRTVKNLFAKFCRNGGRVFKGVEILKLEGSYKFNVAGNMYKMLNWDLIRL